MNESEKNIETCLPESILAEVASLPTDPQFVSLVNESLDPLKQQAADREGWDAYNEVVASHQPYTFTSSVRQMKSNLILLLRRFWRFPFGTGTLRSLSDMWAHYITRLQGSETYGIQSRLDQLTDLPSAPLLVADRKISEPNAIDGISLIQQIAGTIASSMTSLVDTTNGWTFRSTALFSIFSAVEEWTLNCKDYIANSSYGYNYGQGFFKGNNTVKKLNIPEFEGWQAEGTALYCYIAANCANIEEIHAPAMWRFNGENSATNTNNISQNPKLWCVEMGDMKDHLGWSVYYFYQCPKLIRLEFKGVQGSISLSQWNPSYVLSDNPTGTDLIEEGSTAANNLEQFLQNFRLFIVLRLANRKTTTALTLTISANVYNAVTGANSGWASQHTLADLGITDNDLTDLETELGITSATIYASWLDTYTGANGIHWDINKAN